MMKISNVRAITLIFSTHICGFGHEFFKKIKALSVLLMILSLTACGSHEAAYLQHSNSVPPLTVPPGLTGDKISYQYVVPDAPVQPVSPPSLVPPRA